MRRESAPRRIATYPIVVAIGGAVVVSPADPRLEATGIVAIAARIAGAGDVALIECNI